MSGGTGEQALLAGAAPVRLIRRHPVERAYVLRGGAGGWWVTGDGSPSLHVPGRFRGACGARFASRDRGALLPGYGARRSALATLGATPLAGLHVGLVFGDEPAPVVDKEPEQGHVEAAGDPDVSSDAHVATGLDDSADLGDAYAGALPETLLREVPPLHETGDHSTDAFDLALRHFVDWIFGHTAKLEVAAMEEQIKLDRFCDHGNADNLHLAGHAGNGSALATPAAPSAQ